METMNNAEHVDERQIVDTDLNEAFKIAQQNQVEPTDEVPTVLPEKIEEDESKGIVLNNDVLFPKQEIPDAIPESLKTALDAKLNELDEDTERLKKEYDAIIESRKGAITKPLDEVEEDSDIVPEDEVLIILDKSGLNKIEFTEEERKKLEISKVIKVQEVEVDKLPINIVKRSKNDKEKPNPKTLLQKRQVYGETNVVLPNSGYIATISGGSPFEIFGLGRNDNDIERVHARWSFIYSKIKSTSIGEMTFDQFLENTSYLDLEMLSFGLLRTSYPDLDKLQLTCNNEECGKAYGIEYKSSELLLTDKVTDKLYDKIEEISSAITLDDALNVHRNSKVMINKRAVLGDGVIVEVNSKNAKTYIESVLNQLNAEIDPNLVFVAININAIYIPNSDEINENTEYEVYDSLKDITDIISVMDADDIRRLYTIITDSFEDSFEFGIRDVVCPHCKHKTDIIRITPSDLLFTMSQMAVSGI